MALDRPYVIDAIGIEEGTGCAVLTIADSWDWEDEGPHLLALQAKLNSYFEFIESGQVWESHPGARGRELVIELVSRFPLPQNAQELVHRASEACSDLRVRIRTRHYEGSAA
jgi:hypothetical protein